MARKVYDAVHEDVQGEFDSVILTTNLENLINIKVLGDERQKKEVIKVHKTNDITFHLTGEDVVLTVNQGIFEQLTSEQKVIAIESVLAGISYSHDKELPVTNVADVKTFSGVLSKFGYEKYEVLQESVRTLFAKKEGEDKA